MSRIENALEKAIQMREAAKVISADPQVEKEREKIISKSPGGPVFKVREPIIDFDKVDAHIVSLTEPGSIASEQYRKMRARIISTTKPHSGSDFKNSLIVASADVGEGKTVTAINFAITMAQEMDHTVLLVDADLRKPSIHTCLGMKAERGLSEYLCGKAQLSEVLINTGIGKLVFLPAGSPPPNPSELLSSKRMKDLVQELKSRYHDRYIIFDSSPVLVAADTISLTSHVDGVILVVQAARTSESDVKKAMGLIKNVHILGVVYNNVPEYIGKHSSYNYNYYRSGTGSRLKDSIK